MTTAALAICRPFDEGSSMPLDEILEPPGPIRRRAFIIAILGAVAAIMVWRVAASTDGSMSTPGPRTASTQGLAPSVDHTALHDVSVTATPAFQVASGPGPNNARYTVALANLHDYPVTLLLAALRVPATFALLGGLPPTVTIAPQHAVSVTLALHTRRCARRLLVDPPITLQARAKSEPWQFISVALPGNGPYGSWVGEVEQSACSG